MHRTRKEFPEISTLTCWTRLPWLVGTKWCHFLLYRWSHSEFLGAECRDIPGSQFRKLSYEPKSALVMGVFIELFQTTPKQYSSFRVLWRWIYSKHVDTVAPYLSGIPESCMLTYYQISEYLNISAFSCYRCIESFTEQLCRLLVHLRVLSSQPSDQIALTLRMNTAWMIQDPMGQSMGHQSKPWIPF